MTKGINPEGGSACLIAFSPTGVGSCLNVTAGTLSTTGYTYPLSSAPTASDGTPYVYIPSIISARMYFSLGTAISMSITPNPPYGLGINDPNPADPADYNYNILYDKVEMNILENQLAINPTMVDFFSLPLPISVYTNNQCAVLNVGMPPTQNREGVFTSFEQGVTALVLNPSATTEWRKLILTGPTSGPTHLRLLSSGQAMNPSNVAPIFDPHYLLDSNYGLNWMDTVWGTAGSNTGFYQANPVLMDLSEVPGYGIWTGQVDSSAQFNFTGIGGGGSVQIIRPSTSIPFFVGTSFTATGDPTAIPIIARLLGAGFACGQVPSTGPLNDAYFIANQPYYQNNSHIPGATTTGPWYDFYSKELHDLGNSEYQFFTYPYDDSLGYKNLITLDNLILLPAQVLITLGDMTGTSIPP